ncbi:MAG: hypothetical protein QXG39_02100 [Candidatus Aenigmatarchaeota archaeon]
MPCLVNLLIGLIILVVFIFINPPNELVGVFVLMFFATMLVLVPDLVLFGGSLAGWLVVPLWLPVIWEMWKLL